MTLLHYIELQRIFTALHQTHHKPRSGQLEGTQNQLAYLVTQPGNVAHTGSSSPLFWLQKTSKK